MNILNKICSYHQDIATYISTFLFGNCNYCNKKTHCDSIIHNITVYKLCILDSENDIRTEYIIKKSVIYKILCKRCYHQFLINKYNMYISD